MTDEVIESPQYDCVEDLLDAAFRLEAKELYPQAGFDLTARGTNPVELSAQDLIAHGVMLRSMARRSAGTNWLSVLVRYRVPVGPLFVAHEINCVQIHYPVRTELARHMRRPPKWWKEPDRISWLVVDLVRGWSFNGRQHIGLERWARRTDISKRTLIRWKQRAHDNLTTWLEVAEHLIQDEAAKRNLIRRRVR